MNARRRERYAANREAILQRNREWLAANRDAVRAQQAMWREANRDAINANNHERALAHRYGLSLADEAHLLAMYDGLCHCCRSVPPIEIDHDHAEGGEAGGPDKARLRRSVRGLVCSRCNSVVALIENRTYNPKRRRKRITDDDIARVKRYLARPNPFA